MTHARSSIALLVRAVALAMLLCATSLAMAAHARADDVSTRDGGSSWSALFAPVRPVPASDTRRVIVMMDGKSLSAMVASRHHPTGVRRMRAFVRSERAAQDAVLQRIRAAGVQFTLVHRYLNVINGVSIVIHGDGAQMLWAVKGVASVSQVGTVYPAAADTAGDKANAQVDAAAHATVSAGSTDKGHKDSVTVAVLDTAIDFNSPSLAGSQGGPGVDVVDGEQVGVVAGSQDGHGTQVAGGVLAGAGASTSVQLVPIRILGSRPVIGGLEAVIGRSDDLVAGLERSVDPNGDGVPVDHVDVAVVASGTPYGGFAGAPVMQAVTGADQLGCVVVAAAGDDGPSGDTVGTIASPAASSSAVAVAAGDLRETAPRADVHVQSSLVDTVITDQAVLTVGGESVDGMHDIVVVAGGAGDVVDYLDDQAQSRVSGSIALVRHSDAVQVADQARAAADAGAVGLIVAGAGDARTAGTIDAPGVTIPVVGISRETGDALGLADSQSSVEVSLSMHERPNPAYGHVAGFSSRGPRYDGTGKPDLVGPGVAVPTVDVGVNADGHARSTFVTGTSIAAAQVAGQVAALRAAHRDWTTAWLRSALLGTARQLGVDPLVAQGAGVIDVNAASAARIIAEPGRLDFAVVAAGGRASLPLKFRDSATGDEVLYPPLRLKADWPSDVTGPAPSVSGSSIVVDVPVDTAPGTYGGWLQGDDMGIRVPWTVVVRDPSDVSVPIDAKVSRERLDDPTATSPASLSLGVGGQSQDGSLGIRGASSVRVELQTLAGAPVRQVGHLVDVMPGIYTLMIDPHRPDGTSIGRGSYRLAINVDSALAGGLRVESSPVFVPVRIGG